MPATARNNVLAGLFVVGGLALGVWVSFMLGESTGMSGLPFTVRFSIEDGAVGLKPGSAVLLGGKQVGRVTTVDFAPGAAPGDPPLGVDVNVEIRGDLTIYENASITLVGHGASGLEFFGVTECPEVDERVGTSRLLTSSNG